MDGGYFRTDGVQTPDLLHLKKLVTGSTWQLHLNFARIDTPPRLLASENAQFTGLRRRPLVRAPGSLLCSPGAAHRSTAGSPLECL